MMCIPSLVVPLIFCPYLWSLHLLGHLARCFVCWHILYYCINIFFCKRLWEGVSSHVVVSAATGCNLRVGLTHPCPELLPYNCFFPWWSEMVLPSSISKLVIVLICNALLLLHGRIWCFHLEDSSIWMYIFSYVISVNTESLVPTMSTLFGNLLHYSFLFICNYFTYLEFRKQDILFERRFHTRGDARRWLVPTHYGAIWYSVLIGRLHVAGWLATVMGERPMGSTLFSYFSYN